MENRSFEEWYDAFVEFVRGHGYSGPLDKDSFVSDYEDGLDAFYAAEYFIRDLNE